MENQRSNVLKHLRERRNTFTETKAFYTLRRNALNPETPKYLETITEYNKGISVINSEIDSLDLCILWMLTIKDAPFNTENFYMGDSINNLEGPAL